MLALRSAPPPIGIAEAERVALERYGLAVTMRRMSGERDANFHARTADGSHYVLKILTGPPDLPATDCLVRVLRHLAEQDPGLAVPKVCPTQQGAELAPWERDDGTYTACLFTYLPGRLLADAPPGRAPPVFRQVGVALARVDRGLRGFFHPALAQRIAWDVRRLPELMKFAPCIRWEEARRDVEDTAASIKSLLPQLRGLRHQAIHGDCHAGNLLVDHQGGISGILDFGDLIHAPLILEVAVALAELSIDGIAPVETAAPLLAGYAAMEALEAADIDALFDLIAGRHAVSILVHSWRGHEDGGGDPAEQELPSAAPALRHLRELDRGALTREWQALVCGVRSRSSSQRDSSPVDLSRRHRLMGAGAELFYDKPLHLVRGEGVWLFDGEERAYLDAYNNVPHVGHAQPDVVRAIQEQTAILQTHTRYLHGGILDYAEQLTAHCPPHLNSGLQGAGACIFVNSGSEANDVAWRLARFATGQRGALIMAHAYHGITDAVAALTPKAGEPRDPHVVTLAPPPSHLTVGDAMDARDLAAAAEDVERAIRLLAANGFAPAAFFLDTALTSSGIFDAPPAWLAAVAERVRAAGGLVIADEVQYGLGRSGSHFWGFERRGLSPDIVTLGKPLGNGYPMGAVIADRSLIEAFQAKFGFFSTFGGSPVAAAAGRAVLDVIDRQQLLANARETGAYLRARLEAMAAPHDCFGAVRGAGLLVGLEVRATEAKLRTQAIVNRLAAHSRILIGSEGPSGTVLKLRPPMPFRPEHVDLLVDAIDAAALQTAARPN